ncbi:UNVERIFIED_CONTAM: Kr-h1 [Trichonephila clavipes]
MVYIKKKLKESNERTSKYNWLLLQFAWKFQYKLYSDSFGTLEKNSKDLYKAVGKHYYCLLCSYTSLVKGNMIRHLRTHTNERPHSCPICNKGFITKESCQLHIRIHSGEQPHVCNICGKAFSQRGNYKRHLFL